MSLSTLKRLETDVPAPPSPAPDGVIEGIERPGERMVLAVQWHLERIFEYPRHRKLFEAIVEAASLWRAVRKARSSR